MNRQNCRVTAPSHYWPFEIRSLSPSLGAEVVGVGLEEAASEEVFPAVYRAFLEYQVIMFRDIDLPPALQVKFARNFGEVQVHVMNQYHGYTAHPEIYFLSNLDENGNPIGAHPDKGTMYWHTDGSWQRRTGLATIMYAEIVPMVGGETHFCDMYGAYAGLSGEMKDRLSRLRGIHNLDFSWTRRHSGDPLTEEQKAQVPPVDHPIVRTHPETGRKCVFLGDHAECVQGMDYEEGRAMIEEVNRLAAADHLIYRHKWEPRQLIVWDNRCVLHRATAYDTAGERRVMRRCTVIGDEPY